MWYNSELNFSQFWTSKAFVFSGFWRESACGDQAETDSFRGSRNLLLPASQGVVKCLYIVLAILTCAAAHNTAFPTDFAETWNSEKNK